MTGGDGEILARNSMPSPKAYDDALRAAGHHAKATAVKEARRHLAKRRDEEADERDAYLAAHERVAKRAAAAIESARAMTKSLSQADRLRVSLDGSVWHAQAKALAAIDAWRKDAKAAGKVRKAAVLWLVAEAARRAIAAATDAIGTQLKAMNIDPATLDIGVLRAMKKVRNRGEWLSRAFAALPTAAEWKVLDDATTAYGGARVRASSAASAQPLTDLARAEGELAVVRAFASGRSVFDAWGKNGFTDHDALFVWAMYRGGWCWGAEFTSPDLHHFQYFPGRACKAQPGDEPLPTI